jgi:hypothetical protein
MSPLPDRTQAAVAALLLALGAGCASTQATTTMQYGGALPRPRAILVYRFATSPQEVQLDRSPTSVLQWKAQGISSSGEQLDVAHQVSATLADHLVQKIQAMGLPAQLGEGPPDLSNGPVLVVDGQFIAIDEGSRALRVVIGLGAGRSNVRTAVQVLEVRPAGRRVVDEFEVDAKSGRKPGAAETMGAGGAAGVLATSAAVTAAGSVASEVFGANVDADAERTASKVASMLAAFFAQQGWIPPQGGTL